MSWEEVRSCAARTPRELATASDSVEVANEPYAVTPASSLKWSRRVPVDAPEPFAAWASTIDVTKAVISVDSSVCTRGRRVETIAIRSWRIVTSPPTMRPSRRSAASPSARAASRLDERNVLRAPPTMVLVDLAIGEARQLSVVAADEHLGL